MTRLGWEWAPRGLELVPVQTHGFGLKTRCTRCPHESARREPPRGEDMPGLISEPLMPVAGCSFIIKLPL